ncbi:MAG: LpxL/LpxP family Kdo(2)-lipid IV(A) lauroyl/palmitoleoyl acyltransferase [Cellvibrio sp.]|uniref:LpxL/LpxP family Kdo(2)-lipid IV(A) lauroyl/palmitoleoyl acyltransferase n=1 Tax=Cellvibrio sp. TaxID=1965322 RepID=UPI0031A21966
MAAAPEFSRALLAPRHWPTWFGFGVWFLIAQLPYSWQMSMARVLTPLLNLNKKRVAMARTNLQLCFPQKSPAELELLLKKNIESTAIAAFETGIGFFWAKSRLRKLFTITGVEYVEQAKAEGQGAMLLSLHFTTLDIGSAMLGIHVNYDGMYTPHKNPVFDYVQKVRREAYAPGGIAFSRDNVRAMVSQLRKGRMIWYAPDRDMGEKISVFVPFFGVPAATVTATAQFARMGRAKIIPFSQYRLENDKGYQVVIHPPFENYPTGDELADARRINEYFEQEILKVPEQYLWAQPRFKSRPNGEPSVY